MAKNIAASRQKKPSGLSDKVSDIVLVVICAAIMLIVAYPLYYVLVASFSDPYDVYAGKTFLLPSQFTLKGYQAVFADSALFSGFVNSIKYTVIGTIYSVVMIYLVAYPLSVKDLPGRKYISLFFVITMYFGGGLVPTYLIVKQTGLLDDEVSRHQTAAEVHGDDEEQADVFAPGQVFDAQRVSHKIDHDHRINRADDGVFDAVDKTGEQRTVRKHSLITL